MGVRGLESFIKENRTSLCRTITLSADNAGEQDQNARTPVVVDAWGIVFKLYLDTLPWTSGGEYLRFYSIVKSLISAWRKVGLEPVFVFDGAAPAEKHDTLVKRGQEKIVACQLFYTTSIASRSAPSFSRQSPSVVLPFFASHAFILALHRLGVDAHFVPQGEADGVCVVMADKLGGYVLGRDSDFAVLVGRTERCRGYVPLDMMSWIEGKSQEDQLLHRPPGAGESFQPVHNGRRRPYNQTNHRQSSLLPSPSLANPTLVLTTIPPQALRQRLRLPATYLPLFASLCGTDYTPPSITQQFFEPNLSAFQRIEKAARILREQLYAPSPQSRGGRSGSSTPNPADQVVQLVKRVIKKLCVYPYDTEQALDDTVDTVIEGALQYQLPRDGSCCSLYPFCGELDPMGCQTPVAPREGSLLPVVTDRHGHDRQARAKEAYAEARRMGLLSTITHGWLFPDRMYMWQVLEDPSGPNWKTTEAAKELRRAAWIVADEGLGGLRWPQIPASDEVEVSARQDDLPNGEPGPGPEPEVEIEIQIDDEKQEDKALRDLLGVDHSETNSEIGVSSGNTTLVDVDVGMGPSGSASASSSPVRAIIEWCRPGSLSKIAGCPLVLPPARSLGPDDTPTCLLPLEQRLRIYLATLHSDTTLIRALPVSLQPLVSLIRFCVLDAAHRPSAKTDAHKWRVGETTAVLRAALGTYSMWYREIKSESGRSSSSAGAEAGPTANPSSGLASAGANASANSNWPLLENRNAGIVAHIGSACADAHVLAQALLLMPTIASPTDPDASSTKAHDGDGEGEDGWGLGPTHMIPYLFLGGINLHLLLSKLEPGSSAGWEWGEKEQSMFERCWSALIDGLDGAIVGLIEKPSKPADLPEVPGSGSGDANGSGKHDTESEDRKKSKKKKRRNDRHNASGASGASGREAGTHSSGKGGRFDLLDGLGM